MHDGEVAKLVIMKEGVELEMDFEEALEMDAKLIAKYMISLYND
jgi:hypothetical protein